MKNGLESFTNLYKDASASELLSEFLKLSVQEQCQVLKELVDLAASPRHTSKAIVSPNGANIIKRRLKPGVEFNRWYQEWLPPVEAQTIGKDKVRNYFPIPVRVINLRPVQGGDEFLTVSFLHSPYNSVEELLNSKPKDVQEKETQRKKVNENLLADAQMEFYSIASDDIFGL